MNLFLCQTVERRYMFSYSTYAKIETLEMIMTAL